MRASITASLLGFILLYSKRDKRIQYYLKLGKRKRRRGIQKKNLCLKETPYHHGDRGGRGKGKDTRKKNR